MAKKRSEAVPAEVDLVTSAVSDAMFGNEPIEGIPTAPRPTKPKANPLAKVAKRFADGGWMKPREVLKVVRAVPTIFPQFDFVTGVGGLPLDRVHVMTGPSNNGKTEMALGFIKSFLVAGHFAALVDAEQTTPITWVEQLMGEHADSPAFQAMRPRTFEDAVDGVRKFCTTIAEARAAGEVPEETAGIVVVDSIKKLTPKKFWDLMQKEGLDPSKGFDGVGNRGAQLKALFNSIWMDELVPLMANTGCAIVIIARESERTDAQEWEKRTGDDWKLTGGKALFFDSSLVLRVLRDKSIQDDDKRLIGERHKVRIEKTKVAGKEERRPTAFFHTRTAVDGAEPGFDGERDLLELAVDFGVVEKKGSQFWTKDGNRIANGFDKAVAALRADVATRKAIEAWVRAEFADRVPAIEETGEVE